MPKQTQTFDTLLVGGGVIGLSLAWELAQQGSKVCVIEKDRMGSEASWAAAGMLPPGPSRQHWPQCSTYDQLQGLGQELHPLWSDRLLETTDIDTGFRQTGAIYVGNGAPVDEWDRWGLTYHKMEASGVADLEPALSAQSDAFYLPGESQLRPPRHMKALVSACQREGVYLRPGCELLGWKTDRERITWAITSTGEITAGSFCLTSGCWTGGIAAHLGLELPIRPVRGQILLLNGPPNTLRHIVNAGPQYLTPRSDGRVLVGSTQEDVGFNKQNTAEGLAGLLSFAIELCPPLAKYSLEKSWSGLRPGTADELPYLGRLPRYENGWIAAGHFRAGIQLSPATAVVMRALMLGQQSPVDVTSLSAGLSRRR